MLGAFRKPRRSNCEAALFRVTLLHTGSPTRRTLPQHADRAGVSGADSPGQNTDYPVPKGITSPEPPAPSLALAYPLLPAGPKRRGTCWRAPRGGAGRGGVLTSGRKRTLRAAAWKPAVTGISVAPRTLVSLALGSGCVGRACSSLELWRPGLTRPRPLLPPPPRPPPRARAAPAPARRPRRRLRPEGS